MRETRADAGGPFAAPTDKERDYVASAPIPFVPKTGFFYSLVQLLRAVAPVLFGGSRGLHSGPDDRPGQSRQPPHTPPVESTD